MQANATERYQSLIGRLCVNPPGFVPTRESAGRVQVERGTVLADVLAGRTGTPLPAAAADVVDAAGHRRPAYRPLLVYAHLLAGMDVGESWLASLAVDVDVPLTAAAGAAAATAAWSALAKSIGGEGGSGQMFARLAAEQRPNGALLVATPSDNPETHWYHELVILHATADHALWSGDASVWAAVERATMFHLNETEPDHATGQPWGLPAFVRVPGAEPLADALLHAVSAHQPGGPSGVALLLLADTLYGLRNAPQRAALEIDLR